MNAKQDQVKKKKVQAKMLALREKMWPGLAEEDLWDSAGKKGWVTIPRTLPLILRIIDELTPGKPAGRTFFGLWARDFGERMIEITNQAELAVEAGHMGNRAVTGWRQKMRLLQDLGFIGASDGPEEFHYVLIYNPFKVIKRLEPKISKSLFIMLLARAHDVGAKEMSDDEPSEESSAEEDASDKVPS